MKTQLLSTSIICIITAGIPFPASAEATGPNDATTPVSRDVAEHRLDRKGDRIDGRLDRKGARIDARLDNKGERAEARYDARADRAREAGKDGLANKLERRGDRIDRRLDRKGDRLNARLDRKGNFRQARRNSQVEAGRHTGRQHQSGHRARSGANRKVSGKRRR